MSVLSDEVRPPQWIERSTAILWTPSFQDELWAHTVKEQNDRSWANQVLALHRSTTSLRKTLFTCYHFVFLLGPNGVSSMMGLS